MRTTRSLCVVMVLLVVLVLATAAMADETGAVARLDGTAVACANCALATMLGAPVQVATATAELDLDDPRWEASAVVSISPKRTGTGGAISYRVASNATQTRGVWADVGLLRWGAITDEFIGLSTNIPMGQTLTATGRVGIGGLLETRDVFCYTRAAWKF